MVKRDPAVLDRAVRKTIFSGQFKPGDHVVESRLAKELGVSRIPVRESLSRLVGQGVLQSGGKWQGVRLREYSIVEINELYEYRRAIEGQAAELAAIRATPVDLESLELVYERLDQLASVETYGSAEWSSADERFHRLIASLSKNSRIQAAFDSILMESRFAFYQNPLRVKYLTQGNQRLLNHREEVAEQHRRIYEAIVNRHPDEARKVSNTALDQASSILSYLFTLEEISENNLEIS